MFVHLPGVTLTQASYMIWSSIWLIISILNENCLFLFFLFETGLALVDCSASSETIEVLTRGVDLGCFIVLANKKPLTSSMVIYASEHPYHAVYFIFFLKRTLNWEGIFECHWTEKEYLGVLGLSIFCYSQDKLCSVTNVN